MSNKYAVLGYFDINCFAVISKNQAHASDNFQFIQCFFHLIRIFIVAGICIKKHSVYVDHFFTPFSNRQPQRDEEKRDIRHLIS